LFKCNEKNKVEAIMVEANGFKPSLNDAKLLGKGFENVRFYSRFHGDKKLVSSL
jgi:hypothetical protein